VLARPDRKDAAEDLSVYEAIDKQGRHGSGTRVVNAKVEAYLPAIDQFKRETRELFASSAPEQAIDESALDNWIAKQSEGDLFVTCFASGRSGWTVVDPKTLEQLRSGEPGDFWKRFHTMFPGESAIESWSRVGFSADEYDGKTNFSQHLLEINRKPPQDLINGTRPVMYWVEQRLEEECGMTGLTTSIQEFCRGVECRPLGTREPNDAGPTDAANEPRD
jgi:hypothetical protein